MERILLSLAIGLACALCMAALVHGAVRLKRQVPDEDRAWLDPLPRPLRLLWPLIRLLDYHLGHWLPRVLLAGPGEQLRLSGLLYLMSATQFIALCVVSMAGFGLLAVSVLTAAGLFNWTAVLLVAMVGFMYPRLWLKDALKTRRKLIIKALPTYLDFMVMSVEAGLNMAGAISQAVAKGPAGPLKSEFAFVLRDLRAGLTRAEALRRMEERLRLPQISAVIQAERMGASLGATFRAQAEQRRAERFQRAEQLAMEAPVKLIFPLVAFIFPVTFLVLIFPIAMKFLQSGVDF